MNPWESGLPLDWSRHRLKWCFKSCRNGVWGEEPDGENDIVVVRVADFDRVGFRVSLASPTMRAITPHERGTRLLKDSDLLIEKSGGGELQPVGFVVSYEHDVPAVCSNFVARLEVSEHCEPRFLTYLNAHLYSNGINKRSIKQTTGIQNLDADSYLSELVAVPDRKGQRRIADYLDAETAEIDALIAEKGRMLTLLEEKRAALVTQAVTRGLNCNVPLKPSGLEWLGDVPKHWQVERLKFWSPQITVGIVVTPAKYYVDVGVPCLRSLNVRPFEFRDADLVFISDASNQLHAKSMIWKGDIVAVRTGQPGTTAVVDERFDGANCIDLIIIRKSRAFVSEYLCYFMNSTAAHAQYESGAVGGLQQHFNIEQATNLLVAWPPIDEQIAIVADLDRRFAQSKSIETNLRNSIELLRERRSALITAAVTGQIPVEGMTL